MKIRNPFRGRSLPVLKNPFRGQPLPVLNRAAEYEAEAREDRMLYQFWGWLDAGLFNPAVVKRRYERHREWYGIEVIQWRVWLAWLLVAAVAVGSAFFTYGFVEASNVKRTQPTSPWAGAVVGAAVSIITFALPITGWMSTRRYGIAYAPLTIWQRDPENPLEMIEGRRGHVPRLCFLTPHESGVPWYRAPTRTSAQLKGTIHLWWPEEMGPLQDWDCEPEDLWKLPPAEYGLNEVAAARYASHIEDYAGNGHAHRLATQGAGWALFNEVWPVVVIVVGFVMLMFIVAGGQSSA